MKNSIELTNNASLKAFKLLLIITLIIFYGCQTESQEKTAGEELSVDVSQLTNLIGQDFMIDDQHSYVGFKIKYFGFSPVRGRFDRFDGTVFYDPDNLGALSVSLIIDVSSINTGQEMRDSDLQTDGPGWFNVKDFPQIRFNSTKVIAHEDGEFSLQGDLTINGITKPISAQFSAPTPMSKDLWANDQVDFSGRLMIDRMDFEVSGGDFWSKVMENGITQLSHDVEIELDIHTRRTDYLARMATEDSTNIRVTIPRLVEERGIEAAIQEIEDLRNLAESPVSSGALSTIGYSLMEQNKIEEAKSIFLLRQELYPGRVSSHTQLGIIALAQGKHKEARDFFAMAVSQDSSYSKPVEYLKLIDRMD